MQTQHLAPDIAEERLDWFTYDIQPDGTQICAIRPAGRPGWHCARSASVAAPAAAAERNRAGPHNPVPANASGSLEGPAQSARPAPPSDGLNTIRLRGSAGW